MENHRLPPGIVHAIDNLSRMSLDRAPLVADGDVSRLTVEGLIDGCCVEKEKCFQFDVDPTVLSRRSDDDIILEPVRSTRAIETEQDDEKLKRVFSKRRVAINS